MEMFLKMYKIILSGCLTEICAKKFLPCLQGEQCQMTNYWLFNAFWHPVETREPWEMFSKMFTIIFSWCLMKNFAKNLRWSDILCWVSCLTIVLGKLRWVSVMKRLELGNVPTRLSLSLKQNWIILKRREETASDTGPIHMFADVGG